MKTTVLLNMISKRYLLAFATGTMLAFTGAAQTYTTQAKGNWSDPATWTGGQVPGSTISSGMTVNILHEVTCNVNGDLTISGVLNISGDTLRFNATYDKKVTINSSGFLNVKNGGFVQYMPGEKNEMEINGGRISVENSRFTVSKNFQSGPGSKRTYKNSTILVGDKYEMQGNGGSKAIDSIINSTLEVLDSDCEIKNHSIVRVSNVTLKVNDGELKVESNADIIVLPGAKNNFGFDVIKLKEDLENNGDWDARVDAFCIDGNIVGNKIAQIDFTRPEDCTLIAADVPAPELIFANPVLISGQANKQGAVYMFSNIYPGIDARVKLARFSRNDIVMKNFDKADMGWGKALQPEFGLPGLVKPNQNWYIDFELTFYEAGTNNRKSVRKVDVTALDVDGDNNSVMEYAVFQNPHSVVYSTVTFLNNQPNIQAGGSLLCTVDGLLSPLVPCLSCGGDGKSGYWNFYDCSVCDGSGQLFSLCNHAYETPNGNTLLGPVDNFVNIDTAATQVMATYQYFGVERIKFRYGAKSGSKSSNGSGVRLNSLWFRQFSMEARGTLPVKLSNFNATYDKKNVVLSWTGLEENFSHYVLQRSVDGKEFSDVATIFATGNTTSTTDYRYKDMNVSSSTGMLFYRLELVDKVQEVARYSEVRAVRLSKDQESMKLAAYPNPVIDQVRLTLPDSWQGKPVMIELYTVNGRRVQSMQVGSASQTETLNMGKYNKGSYLVKVICEGEVAQQMVIKK